MCASETKTVHVRVEGLVQGVGFRAFAVRRALELGIGGFVRNTADGAVELEAQADSAAIERFLVDVKEGPRMARVDSMRVETMRVVSGYSSFDLRW